MGGLHGLDVGRTILRSAVACAVMAGVMGVIVAVLGPRLGTDGLVANATLVLSAGAAGVVTFVGMALLLRMDEMRTILGPLLRRL